MDRMGFVALDTGDLEVVSAHLQDATVDPAEILWRPKQRRVVIGLNRIDRSAPPNQHAALQRQRAVLRFDCVRSCKFRGFDPQRDRSLNLLAVEYAESSGAPGIVTLIFTGRTTFRLEVECLEAELVDLVLAPAAAQESR